MAQCTDQELTVKMDSKYDFLTLTSETYNVQLTGTTTTEGGLYEDAKLQFVYGENGTWNVPIKVNFTICSPTNLSFTKVSLKIVYKIGSGE